MSEPDRIVPITGERDLDFVLTNARDVAALKVLWERANRDVPKWLTSLTKRVLFEECADLISELKLAAEFDQQDDQIHWRLPGFSKHQSPGFWLLIPPNLEWLVRDGASAPVMYLWCYDGPELREWVRYVDQQRAKLTAEGLRVLGSEDDDRKSKGRTLLSRNLDRVLQDALKTGDLRQPLAQEIRDFTRSCAEFLRGQGAPNPGRTKGS